MIFVTTNLNLTSNVKTHKNVLGNFIYKSMFYIPTKYEEHWRALLISHPTPCNPFVNRRETVGAKLKIVIWKFVSASMIFKITLCTCVSKYNFNIQFCMANQVCEIFEKLTQIYFCRYPLKKTTFGTNTLITSKNRQLQVGREFRVPGVLNIHINLLIHIIINPL